MLSIHFINEGRHRKRKKCQLLDNSMEEVVTLRSVTVETGSGFLSGAWAPFVWAWDRQGNPAFVPHLLGFSGSLSLLYWQGLSFTYKPLPTRSGFCSKFMTINFEMVHVTLLIQWSQHIIVKTSFYLGVLVAMVIC